MACPNIQTQVLDALGIKGKNITKATIRIDQKGIRVECEYLVFGDIKDGIRELSHITKNYELTEKAQ